MLVSGYAGSPEQTGRGCNGRKQSDIICQNTGMQKALSCDFWPGKKTFVHPFSAIVLPPASAVIPLKSSSAKFSAKFLPFSNGFGGLTAYHASLSFEEMQWENRLHEGGETWYCSRLIYDSAVTRPVEGGEESDTSAHFSCSNDKTPNIFCRYISIFFSYPK